MNQHSYEIELQWTGNNGQGTSDYRAYRRDYIVSMAGKPDLPGSSDPLFRGDPSRYNPEDLLVASLSACHMLWYLHLCATAGIIVERYRDVPVGTMALGSDGSGEFKEVVLRPQVEISRGDSALARSLHEKAHSMCFIARSVNFPVRHEPVLRVVSDEACANASVPEGSA